MTNLRDLLRDLVEETIKQYKVQLNEAPTVVELSRDTKDELIDETLQTISDRLIGL